MERRLESLWLDFFLPNMAEGMGYTIRLFETNEAGLCWAWLR
jgi:hypothetical protein